MPYPAHLTLLLPHLLFLPARLAYPGPQVSLPGLVPYGTSGPPLVIHPILYEKPFLGFYGGLELWAFMVDSNRLWPPILHRKPFMLCPWVLGEVLLAFPVINPGPMTTVWALPSLF